jgi:hypothetical protein
MPPLTQPRYPVYIPSKGRWTHCLTAQCLAADGVPFSLVVEPEEEPMYTAVFGADHVLVLPFSHPGSVIPARNWIKAHAIATGAERHWQLDDNIRHFGRRWRTKRWYCAPGVALAAVEDFTDRYENVAISGMNYYMFVPDGRAAPPFVRNCHVYSCCLFLNAMPYQWRGRYNEDTDICLQALADGWCTIQTNAFLVQKIWTMKMPGGNTTTLYHGDGRLKMARALERLWPGVVTTQRRYQRPQHVVKDAWKQFDTPLRLKPGVERPTAPNEYGMQLTQLKPIRSARLRALVADSLAGPE